MFYNKKLANHKRKNLFTNIKSDTHNKHILINPICFIYNFFYKDNAWLL